MADFIDSLAPTETALSTVLTSSTETASHVQTFVQNTTQGLVNWLIVAARSVVLGRADSAGVLGGARSRIYVLS